ncbi:hypothetical protein RSOLAG22IIIB_10600 [Rhizoctonia solani]|uniref:Uncharacterized protein n=1 Tax=Rhizoctonia solani TaxID=456999 RepID=A0A0K6G3Q6_9AGAM|nr:hypothetical protein RSOLAG22IIIB_10600 [Rhizoctonia solani]
MYSDRPRMVMAGELVGWRKMVGMADYSDGAKIMRRYMHNSIGSKSSLDWQPQLEQEALRFLQKLLRSPENLISHIRQTAGATVVRLTYGYTPKDENDEYIKIAERAHGQFCSSNDSWDVYGRCVPVIEIYTMGSVQAHCDRMAETIIGTY